jgi:lactoylglutathione lyase
VTLRTPQNLSEVNNFMIIRVADIWTYYEEWKKRGAEFLTEPKEHKLETRCYIRDPDGYLIEVGQTK